MSGTHVNGEASALHFEPLARKALDAYELDVAGLALVASDWNHTFKVDATDGKAYALRVYLPDRRADDEILAELAWLDALAKTSGIRAPRPLRSRGGSLVVRAQGEGRESRRVAMFTWVHGQALGDDPDPALVAAFGEGIALLHEHGRSFGGTDGLRRWDSAFPNGDGVALFDEANADVVPASERVIVDRAVRVTHEAVARLRATDEPARIVHGDLHQDNVLVDDGRVSLLDFDDCMMAWPVQDLGMTFWEVGEDEANWAYRAKLREGYERIAPWSERRSGEIDTFAADRGLMKVDDLVRERAGDRAEVLASVRRHAEAITWFLDRAADAR